jgi:CheY-like chemotaxis protein
MNAGKILVVDDEADIRRLLQEILMEEGYDVEVAADARQARAARQRQMPDLVLLDIWMPDTDGITLLREWSSDAPDSCSVVMMSGHGRDGGRGHAAGRVRFYREAGIAGEAAAHGGACAGGQGAATQWQVCRCGLRSQRGSAGP